MTASKTTRTDGEESTDDSDEQRWEYADDGHALEAPDTRSAVATDAVATSTTQRLHEDLTIATEAAARLDDEYEAEVRLSMRNDRLEEALEIDVELDAAEARALARSLQESAREAEEIVVDERVRSVESDR